MKLVGLFHCKETMVGDHMVRGISGGEKKRLTTAEMLVGAGEEEVEEEKREGRGGATGLL